MSALDEFLSDSDQIPNAHFCLLSGGTDGEDGTTSVPGALINHATVAKFQADQQSENRIEIRDAIENCNSHQFFVSNDGLLRTKPTLTNVGDLRIVLAKTAKASPPIRMLPKLAFP